MLSSPLFGTAAMRAVFGEGALLARCAEVEAALERRSDGGWIPFRKN
jgi:hypothetical protein